MSNVTHVIDRIENGIAVLECKATYEIIELPVNALPKGAREGHMLVKTGETFTIDRAATQARREEIKQRFEKILGREEK